MKKYFIVTIFLIFVLRGSAQQIQIMAFPITDYILNPSDSVTIVQLKLPAGFTIKEKTYGLIRSVFNTAGDSVATVGSGRCHLIKENYYYYGLPKKSLSRKPIAGDLLYTDVTTQVFYKGYLLNVIKHAVTINSIEEKTLANLETVVQLKNEAAELLVLEKIMEDVKYTARVMTQEKDNQDMMITKGTYKNQKLFAAMQAVTVADVKYFLQYIDARPEKYAGHTWKFSEIMATWMVSGAPTVK